MPSEPPLLPPRPQAPERAGATLADRLNHLRREPLVGVAVIVMVAIAAGAMWFRSATSEPAQSAPATDPSAPAASAETGGTAASTNSTQLEGAAAPTEDAVPPIVVHVAGAVTRPGVVTVPAGSRVVDAIDAAGGARARADLDRLNLAAILGDGQRVLVARVGDPPSPSVSGGAVEAAEADTSELAPIDLNTATAAELETLPGIGPARAAAILTERERRGGFTSVGQLTAVKGIGDQTLADLKDLVTV